MLRVGDRVGANWGPVSSLGSRAWGVVFCFLLKELLNSEEVWYLFGDGAVSQNKVSCRKPISTHEYSRGAMGKEFADSPFSKVT